MSNEFESQGSIKLDLTELGTTSQQKKWLKFFETPIKLLSKLSIFENYLNDVDQDPSNDNFWLKWIKHLQICCKVLPGSAEITATSSGNIFLANYQYGLLEAIVLMAILKQTLPEITILANTTLQPFTGLTQDIIYDSTQAITWLNKGGALLILVPTDSLDSDIQAIIVHSKASIVPINLSRKTNPWLNYLQHSIPLLTSILAIRDCLKHRGETIFYSIGSEITNVSKS